MCYLDNVINCTPQVLKYKRLWSNLMDIKCSWSLMASTMLSQHESDMYSTCSAMNWFFASICHSLLSMSSWIICDANFKNYIIRVIIIVSYEEDMHCLKISETRL